MKNDISTYNLAVNNSTGLKIFTIKPFNMSVCNFTRESFKKYKNEFKLYNDEGVYILMNKSTNEIYIGQSGGILNRISDHEKDQRKRFWDEAYLFISDDFDYSTRLYIESWLINDNSENLNIKDWTVHNGNKGNEIKEHKDTYSNNVNKNFETVMEEFLNITIPQNLKNTNDFNETFNTDEIFTFSGSKGYDAKLKIDSEGQFILLKGSKIVSEYNPDWISKSYKRKMDEIYSNPDKVVKISDEHYETLVDIKEPKPSFLADLVSGSSWNGWMAFRNSEGKTLNEVHREKHKNNS